MILNELEEVLQLRRSADPAESYSASLFADPFLVQRKIMEEAFEVCHELAKGQVDPTLVAEEAADLIYHLLVGLAGAGVPLNDVLSVLEGRRS